MPPSISISYRRPCVCVCVSTCTSNPQHPHIAVPPPQASTACRFVYCGLRFVGYSAFKNSTGSNSAVACQIRIEPRLVGKLRAEIGWNWADACQIQIRLDFCRTRPELVHISGNIAKHWPDSAEVKPIWVKLGRTPTSIGTILAGIDQIGAKFGQTSVEFDRRDSGIVNHHRPNWVGAH